MPVSASSQPGSGDVTSNTTISVKGREKGQNWNNESVLFSLIFFLIQIKRNLKSLLRMLIMKNGKLSKGQRRETTGAQDRESGKY